MKSNKLALAGRYLLSASIEHRDKIRIALGHRSPLGRPPPIDWSRALEARGSQSAQLNPSGLSYRSNPSSTTTSTGDPRKSAPRLRPHQHLCRGEAESPPLPRSAPFVTPERVEYIARNAVRMTLKTGAGDLVTHDMTTVELVRMVNLSVAIINICPGKIIEDVAVAAG